MAGSSTSNAASEQSPPEASPSPLRKSFSEVLNDNSAAEMSEKTSFLRLKYLSENCPDVNDDVTVTGNNSSTTYHSQRMTMMFQVPNLGEDAEDDEAALAAISKMNQMIHTLVNKLPSIRIGPSNTTTATIKKRN